MDAADETVTRYPDWLWPSGAVARQNKVLEYAGSIIGVSGAILLAWNLPISKWAYVLYFVSQGALMLYCYRTRQPGLFLMQATFLGIDVFGAVRWFH